MKKSLILYIIILFIGLFSISNAGDKFTWDEISEKEWGIQENSNENYKNAVMIFEKVVLDEEDMLDKTYIEIYRRIKIFNQEGYEWADVIVPHLVNDQKTEIIMGRTIHQNGEIYDLVEDQIIEKTILKGKGIKIKQKSFSLSQVKEGVIVEYYIKIKLPHSLNLWVVQKDIYLQKCEVLWKFYRGKDLKNYQYNSISNYITPNYLWLNTEQSVKLDRLPSLKKTKELLFTFNNLHPFKEEAYSVPDISLKTQLRCYYSYAAAPMAFWGETANDKLESLEKFTKKNKKAIKILEQFSTVENDQEKIYKIYEWIQQNITNISYNKKTGKKYKSNKNIDDIIKRGYGTSIEINKLFYDMLREMNIDAKMLYVSDKTGKLFVKDAKYWQFSNSVVTVASGSGSSKYFSPGDYLLPSNLIPWELEGVEGLIVGNQSMQFKFTPFSNSSLNRRNRLIALTFDDEFLISGSVFEKKYGHQARDNRLSLLDESENIREDVVKDMYEEIFKEITIDSVKIDHLENASKPLKFKFKLQAKEPLEKYADKLFLKPFSLSDEYENPFTEQNRNHPVLFDYSFQNYETINYTIPKGWEVEAIPKDTSFTNSIGENFVVFKQFGGKISIQNSFCLNIPFTHARNYYLVRELYQHRKAMEQLTIILRKKAMAEEASPQ